MTPEERAAEVRAIELARHVGAQLDYHRLGAGPEDEAWLIVRSELASELYSGCAERELEGCLEKGRLEKVDATNILDLCRAALREAYRTGHHDWRGPMRPLADTVPDAWWPNVPVATGTAVAQ